MERAVPHDSKRDVREQLTTNWCNGGSAQQWRFTAVTGTGSATYYRISNAYNGWCVDVGWWGAYNRAPVVQAGCWGGDNQLWRKERTYSGAWMLRPKHTQACLDIAYGWAVHWECIGTQWQEFWINN